MNRRSFIGTITAGLLLRPFRAFASFVSDKGLTFLVVGDWGTGGAHQKRVAKGMLAVKAQEKPPQFVLSTGDNIYPSGVASEDDPQWESKFEKIYAGLDLPWWSILGNHDYRGNVDAQMAYGRRNPLWMMPGRTWSKEFLVDDVTNVSITALDTTPLLQKREGWRDQILFLERTLSESKAQKHIVAGHHPLRSYGHYGDSEFLIRNVKPVLDRYGVVLYCCGHDHDLQAIKNPNDAFGCLISGAGGGTRVTTKGQHTVAVHHAGGFSSVTVTSSSVIVKLMDEHGMEVGRMVL